MLGVKRAAAVSRGRKAFVRSWGMLHEAELVAGRYYHLSADPTIVACWSGETNGVYFCLMVCSWVMFEPTVAKRIKKERESSVVT